MILNPLLLKTSILCTLLLISSLVFSQSNRSLSGHIKYKEGLIANDITVSLIRVSDSLVVQRRSNANDGQFLFQDVKPDTYVVIFTSLGTRKAMLGPVTLNKESLILDTIFLNRNVEQLKDVSIKSAQPLIRRSIDKTTLNVENTSLAVGNTALDLINRAPGL